MDTEHVTWIRISRAADLLGASEDTVRRMVGAGRLEATGDPEALAAAATGRGRPPALLVSLQSVLDARSEQEAGVTRERSSDQTDLLARLPKLELELVRTRAELAELREAAALESLRDEVSRLRADVSNIRAVALQAVSRDEALERAERARLESERFRIEAELARLDADSARRDQLRVFLVPDFATEE